MRSRYRVHHPDRAHFVTSTVVEWLPVFSSTACCDILVRSLEHCRHHKALKIYAWVILDNHFTRSWRHQICRQPCDLNSFTAREIIIQLPMEGRTWLLEQLRYRRAAHKPNEYQVWQKGSHPQLIAGDAMMRQKLEYLHNNPLKRGWVAAPEHWRYSSAHEWLGGALPLMRCDAWL